MPKNKILPVLIVFMMLFCTQGCGAVVETAAPEAVILTKNPAAQEPIPTAMPALPQTVEIYRGNLERSGVFTAEAPVDNADLLWQASGATPSASPVLVGSQLLVGSPDGLTALDSQTGGLLWKAQTSGAVSSAPAYWSDTLFVGDANGLLYALKSQTGQQLWTYQTGGPIFSSPAVDESGVYFGSMDGFFYALNPQSGQLLWKFEVAGTADPSSGISKGVRGTPALSGNTLVFASAQSGGASAELYVYALDKISGQKLWEYPTWNQITGPAIADGVVYVGGFGTFTGLRLSDGEPVFNFETDIVSSAPAIVDSVAIFGLDDGHMLAASLRTGEIKWAFNAGGSINSAPSVSGHMVYFGTGAGALYAIDIPSGQAIWIYETGDRIASSPLLAEGAVYFTSDNGTVYALTSRSAGN
ncbi:MAG: PQQ-binding-like beta-propeller repeat protein [Chloroflexi bacterium]|nr:PQQ-binding-like beta-propeller repeat protein [Chloroflexota bacterium]